MLTVVAWNGAEGTVEDDPEAAIVAARTLWDEAVGAPGHSAISIYQDDELNPVVTIMDRRELN